MKGGTRTSIIIWALNNGHLGMQEEKLFSGKNWGLKGPVRSWKAVQGF